MSESAHRPDTQIGQQDCDHDERFALAVAAAIQRLIAERNALRSRSTAQERELARLRRNLTLIRDSYRRLTSEFVTQLQRINSAVGDAVEEPIGSTNLSMSQTERREAPSD